VVDIIDKTPVSTPKVLSSHLHRDPEEWITNLGNLHRMTLYSLQGEIMEEAAKIKQTDTVAQTKFQELGLR
jgi:hypothetical protein